MPVFDSDQFHSLIDGDKELCAELLQLFNADWPTLISGIRAAHQSGDAREIEKLGHRLKGNVRNFFAAKAAGIAGVIEQSGRDGTIDSVSALTDELEAELKVLQVELDQYLQGLNKAAK